MVETRLILLACPFAFPCFIFPDCVFFFLGFTTPEGIGQ